MIKSKLISSIRRIYIKSDINRIDMINWWAKLLKESEGKRHVQYRVLLKKAYPEFDKFCRQYLPDINPCLIVLSIVNKKVFVCKECGNHIKGFLGGNPHNRVSDFCSPHCANISPDHYENIKKSNLEKYGVECPFQMKDFWDKTRKTKIELYGVDHHMKNKHFMAKKEKLLFEKYGVTNTAKLDHVKEKTKETFHKNWENGHNMRDPKHLKEREERSNKKHGVSNPFKLASVQNKIEKTLLERTGYTRPLKNPKSLEKAKQTYFERTGYENPLKNPSVKEKSKKTNMEKFGVEFPSQNSRVLEKIHNSMYSRKDYVTRDGRTLTLQGYEPQVCIKLEEQGFKVFKSYHQIPYIDHKERNKVYHPDLLATKRGRKDIIIEVKSEYTIKGCDKKFKAAYAYAKTLDNEFAVILLNKGKFVIMKKSKEWLQYTQK